MEYLVGGGLKREGEGRVIIMEVHVTEPEELGTKAKHLDRVRFGNWHAKANKHRLVSQKGFHNHHLFDYLVSTYFTE